MYVHVFSCILCQNSCTVFLYKSVAFHLYQFHINFLELDRRIFYVQLPSFTTPAFNCYQISQDEFRSNYIARNVGDDGASARRRSIGQISLSPLVDWVAISAIDQNGAGTNNTATPNDERSNAMMLMSLLLLLMLLMHDAAASPTSVAAASAAAAAAAAAAAPCCCCCGCHPWCTLLLPLLLLLLQSQLPPPACCCMMVPSSCCSCRCCICPVDVTAASPGCLCPCCCCCCCCYCPAAPVAALRAPVAHAEHLATV